MNLITTFRQVIIANELEGDLSFAYKFSDPDGERSGKSGWSFGVCQFDLSNNPSAGLCLKSCRFTDAEITALKAQTIDVHPLETRLQANKAVIDAWDAKQLRDCLSRTQTICERHGITFANDTAILAVADYDNQYYLSDRNQPGYLVYYLGTRGRPVTAEDVLKFKIEQTAYGKKRPGDCQRRYDNLIKIVIKEAAA